MRIDETDDDNTCTSCCILHTDVSGGTTFIENAGGANCVVDGATRRLLHIRCCINDECNTPHMCVCRLH